MADIEAHISDRIVSSLPDWTRITEISQLECGVEYYVTWYCASWGKMKNTIAEFVGSVNGDQVAFEHSDLPWGTLETLQVYIAPGNPNKHQLIETSQSAARIANSAIVSSMSK